MRHTQSLKKNHEFRRLYARGKSKADANLAVYCRKNGREYNRLGITVSGKIGNAVKRNRVRRRIREAYRLSEAEFLPGFDIVIVSRIRASFSDFNGICRSVSFLFEKLGMKKLHGVERKGHINEEDAH